MARGEERKTMFLDVIQELGPGGCQPLWAALDRADKHALRGTSKVRQPGLRAQGMPSASHPLSVRHIYFPTPQTCTHLTCMPPCTPPRTPLNH